MENTSVLKEKCYKSTDISDITSTSSSNNTSYIYLVDIKVSQKQKLSQTQDQCIVYLNLIFSDSSQIQTSCVDIFQKNQTFRFKVKKSIEKIEIINYDSLKKLSKIGLKGASRDFDVLYQDPKYGLSIRILKKNQLRSCRKYKFEQSKNHEQTDIENQEKFSEPQKLQATQ